MRKPIEYTEIETPSISIDKKNNMMKEIFEILEELGATSKDTAKTSKEINSKFKKEPVVKEIVNVTKTNKTKKKGLNTPSFIGSLAGIMSKFEILEKVHIGEKSEVRWYIKGNVKMLNDIKPRDM